MMSVSSSPGVIAIISQEKRDHTQDVYSSEFKIGKYRERWCCCTRMSIQKSQLWDKTLYTTIQPWYGKLLSIDFMVNGIFKSILEIVWS